MSKGPGRLEKTIRSELISITTTENLCRAAYPDVEKIEKKHRVAVLQVVHRLMHPPGPKDDRAWIVKAGSKKGVWEQHFIPGRKTRLAGFNPTAYHEAGHALAILYFGRIIYRVEVGSYDPNYRGQVTWESMDYVSNYDTPPEIRLIISLAGPIAEAHLQAGWPERARGVSQQYAAIYADSGQGDMKNVADILAASYPDSLSRDAAFRSAEKRAQALVRSKLGWNFIVTLAEESLRLKRGKLSGQKAQRLFVKIFENNQLFRWEGEKITLARLRSGWLPLPASGSPEPEYATQSATRGLASTSFSAS